jgi:hypothetical protein
MVEEQSSKNPEYNKWLDKDLEDGNDLVLRNVGSYTD